MDSFLGRLEETLVEVSTLDLIELSVSAVCLLVPCTVRRLLTLLPATSASGRGRATDIFRELRRYVSAAHGRCPPAHLPAYPPALCPAPCRCA